MATKDLGTYYLRVEFEDGSGYMHQWSTSHRYCGGDDTFSPLNALISQPPYENESEIFQSMEFMYTEGNYSCDCNKKLFLAYSRNEDIEDVECGDKIILKRLTAIRPDMTEKVLFENN